MLHVKDDYWYWMQYWLWINCMKCFVGFLVLWESHAIFLWRIPYLASVCKHTDLCRKGKKKYFDYKFILRGDFRCMCMFLWNYHVHVNFIVFDFQNEHQRIGGYLYELYGLPVEWGLALNVIFSIAELYMFWKSAPGWNLRILWCYCKQPSYVLNVSTL